MIIVNTPAKLHAELDGLRFKGGRRQCVSLVATRGNLHAGHCAVVHAANTISDIVIVTILPPLTATKESANVVTASEFHDISLLEQNHVDMLYMPTEDHLFPFGLDHLIQINRPPTESVVEFDSTALLTYIKVINTTQPDIMVWGEKKFLEFAQLRRLVAELDIRTQMQCIPTVRHANGVPVLDEGIDATDDALAVIYQTLGNSAHAIRSGARNFDSVEKTARVALKGAGFKVSYFTILDETTLDRAQQATDTYRIATRVTIHDTTYADSIGLTL